MENPRKILKQISIKAPKNSLHLAFNEVSQILSLAKIEALEIKKEALQIRDKIINENKIEGRNQGYKEVLDKLLDINLAYNKIHDQLSQDMVFVIESISKSLFTEDFQNKFFTQEITSRVKRMLNTAKNENITINDILKIKLPIGRKKEIEEFLSNIFPAENIIECESCEKFNLIFETKFGNIENIPKELLINLITHVKEKLKTSSELKQITSSICEEVYSSINYN